MVGGLSSFRRLFWSIHEILSKTHLNRSQTGQLLNMIDEVKDHLFCFICSKSFITCLWSLCVDVEMRVCLGLNHWSCYQDWAGAWPVATAPPYCDDLSPQPRSHDPGSTGCPRKNTLLCLKAYNSSSVHPLHIQAGIEQFLYFPVVTCKVPNELKLVN